MNTIGARTKSRNLHKIWEDLGINDQLGAFIGEVVKDKIISHSAQMLVVQKLCEIFNMIDAKSGLITSILSEINVEDKE